jgi:peptide/nickel transport system ATP-binding protein
MVFQDPLAAFNPRATVARVLDDPLRIHGVASRAERPRRIAALLERVGLPADLAPRAIHEISGGQRQRVAIARATVMAPSMLLADEPTGNLDRASGNEIIELLERMNREGLTLLIVTHDPDVARRARRVVTMVDGRIVSDGPP